MEEIKFTVASALLRELGERLVGRSHIALAELVKNAYDADAHTVEIRFRANEIEVVDNGHGMNFNEFRDFWMRIGSPHKERARYSKFLKRPMTGSKGVGRLAVQFLAADLEMTTAARKATNVELHAQVNWNEAVEAGDLVNAVARYATRRQTTEFPEASPHGTRVLLRTLNQEWKTEDIVSLAKEIWTLQPPFRANPDLKTDDQAAFEVRLFGPDGEPVEEFEEQMMAFTDLWHARVVGKLSGSGATRDRQKQTVQVSLEFDDGKSTRQTFSIPGCMVNAVEFEIRLFHLKYRQRHGIRVGEARDYLNEFGGVHIYDAGFHLPYYGPESDWLGIEMDHSHRLQNSKLLPERLQVPAGLSFLPTNSRIFGVVHVDTSKERSLASREQLRRADYLIIQISRDRLVDNKPYQHLQKIVRWALDYYAMQEAIRQKEQSDALREIEPSPAKVARVEQILEQHRAEIPKPVYTTLKTEVTEAVKATETEAESIARHAGLLGALATAGIAALAYEHEVNKQLHELEAIANRLSSMKRVDDKARKHLQTEAASLTDWITWTRSNRALFSHLLDEESRETSIRLKAAATVQHVVDQSKILLRGARVDVSDVDDRLRLPKARFAEWAAILQNVLINAGNAMLDSKRKLIAIRSSSSATRSSLLVEDTGCGVDLGTSDELFEPFVRKLTLSAERKALGLGGTGLGLAIVRMIADNVGCRVAFVKPTEGFKTAFRLSWKESK